MSMDNSGCVRPKTCLDRMRHGRTLPWTADAELLEEVPERNNVAGWVDDDYNAYLVDRALALLQAECSSAEWSAFREYVVNARPAGEVAATLGISVNQVYLAKSRILRRLREELRGLLDD